MKRSEQADINEYSQTSSYCTGNKFDILHTFSITSKNRPVNVNFASKQK